MQTLEDLFLKIAIIFYVQGIVMRMYNVYIQINKSSICRGLGVSLSRWTSTGGVNSFPAEQGQFRGIGPPTGLQNGVLEFANSAFILKFISH